MIEKIFKTRLIHKHDTEAKWLQNTTFIPMLGEIIVYDVDENYNYERIKIGDGLTAINALPFVGESEISNLSGAIDAMSDLVGDSSVSEQIELAIADKVNLEHGQYFVTATSEDGVSYTATVPGITALQIGQSFIVVPNMTSTSKSPTLNVNGLGAKQIVRRLSALGTAQQLGYTESWIAQDFPFKVIYDGRYWFVEGLTKPAAVDLYGNVTVEKGGTGASTAEEALVNLGAASAVDVMNLSTQLDTAKIHIGPNEPEDGQMVWIDTDEEGNDEEQDKVIDIAHGGTGATNAADALFNLGITYGTEDLVAGESALPTGALYFVYEE